MRAEFLCVSVLGVASGPGWGWLDVRVLWTPGGLLCWPFWGGGPGVGLALCCFVVYSTGRFVLCLALCHFVLEFSVLLALRLPRLGRRGEPGAGLGAVRTFVRFVLVWICRFPLRLGVWEGLRFVIVALLGLFSYLFLIFVAVRNPLFRLILLSVCLAACQDMRTIRFISNLLGFSHTDEV